MAGIRPRMQQYSGTLAFDETSAAEQNALVIAALTKALMIRSAWIDGGNITQDWDMGLEAAQPSDGTEATIEGTSSGAGQPDRCFPNAVVPSGWGLRLYFQCAGGGGGVVNVPWWLMVEESD